MLQNNLFGKKLVFYYLLTSILTAITTFVLFILLGTNYKASEHSVLLNMVIWSLLIAASFLLVYFTYYFFMRFVKKSKKIGTILNGFALASGFLIILIICLARSKNINDYSYVSIAGALSGIIAFAQVILLIKPKKNRRKTKRKLGDNDLSKDSKTDSKSSLKSKD